MSTTEKKSSEITLGYGGGAYINVNGGKTVSDICWLMINSGSLTKSVRVPTFMAYDMGLEYNETANVRNEVALGSGLIAYQGSINFAITQSALNKLFTHNFLSRNNVFDIQICDGRSTLDMCCCYWTQFTINASPRQVLTGSISFVSTNNQYEEFCLFRESNDIFGESEKPSNKRYNPLGRTIIEEEPTEIDYGEYEGFDEKLIEYWNTGSNGLEDFSLSFTREATPVYLNTASRLPAYVRIGKLDLSGNFSTWKDWMNTKKIYVANKAIEFFGYAVNDSSSFGFEGIDNTGKYNYSIRLYNITGSSKFSWAITPDDNSPTNIDKISLTQMGE